MIENSVRGNSIMSKNFFVAEAAGLEPARSQEVEPRLRSRMSNNITVLHVPFPLPYTGLCFRFEAEGSPTFHHYPVGVRLVY